MRVMATSAAATKKKLDTLFQGYQYLDLEDRLLKGSQGSNDDDDDGYVSWEQSAMHERRLSIAL